MTMTSQTTHNTRSTWIGREGVAALAPKVSGDLLRPGDDAFDAATELWNGTIRRRPALIVRPASTDEVSAAVRFAARVGAPVAVRSGGHNVAGFAMCDDGVVIDLSAMNSVDVDAEQRLARAGGGATWGDLDRATQPHGLAAPGGLVSKTGIGGLTLGGGLGWMRRQHGLSCDNLASVEIVTADGEIRRASEEENPDLFWGIRGGGGNFGVVTQFEYHLHPIGPEVMFAFVLYPLEDGLEVLQGWRAFCDAAPDEVSSVVLCGTAPGGDPFPPDVKGRQFVAIAAVHSGLPEEGEQVMQQLRALGRPLCDFSERSLYIEVQKAFDEDYPDGGRYYWKSLYLDRFDDAAIERVLELAASRPSPLSTVDVWQLGGAMARIGPDATAFGSRDAPYLLGVEANWVDPADDDTNRQWTQGACARMSRFSTQTSYLNFEPDPMVISQPHSPGQDRLAALKRRYDPDNLFRNNHAIAPD